MNQMKKRISRILLAIVMMATMVSCTKEDLFPTPVYNPIDYISIPRAEYQSYNGIITRARYSISNQSNKTLYYCKFRVTQCTEEGVAYYSKVYEIGDKNDMTVWTLPAGDIQLSGYYSVNFQHTENGHITDEIIDAKFY
mgnify:CR=1 FL=1